ncbi:MAG: SDR family oxidoreductase [Paucibacter sp.]|nr:SDR family oxidoreductase [Roseateles sp.]
MTLTVAQAFQGKRVLLTGATGFVAKVVLEKLIREVPDIGAVILPMRGSRDHPDPRSRFHAEVLSSTIFDTLREQSPAQFERFVAERLQVLGAELTEPRLGLDEPAFAQLAEGIDLIVNVAASVDFREELDRALAINTRSVATLCELSEAAGGAPVVQVSTCYVNGYRRGRIEETIESPWQLQLSRTPSGAFDVDALIQELSLAAEQVRQAESCPKARSRALIALGVKEARKRGFNDTYTLTKWLGEQVAWNARHPRSLAVVRPAIVESTWTSPRPGWIEGIKVGDAIILAYARGKTRFFPARRAGVVDIVPVDLVANGIILAGAEALQAPGSRKIYQCGTSTRNPVTIGRYIELCQAEMLGNGSAYPRLIRKPITRPFTAVPRPAFLAALALANVAVCAIDKVSGWLRLDRQPLGEALETTRSLVTAFSFYSSPQYVFENRELLALGERFGEQDRARFQVDPAGLDWAHYVAKVHLPGLEHSAFKAPAPAAPERAAVTATIGQVSGTPAR